MPAFRFRLTGTIEADNEQQARDTLNMLSGIDEIDIEDGPDEEEPMDEEEEEDK